jgi:hypothetical protein
MTHSTASSIPTEDGKISLFEVDSCPDSYLGYESIKIKSNKVVKVNMPVKNHEKS